jgi:PAS domain S-box-containing protein
LTPYPLPSLVESVHLGKLLMKGHERDTHSDQSCSLRLKACVSTYCLAIWRMVSPNLTMEAPQFRDDGSEAPFVEYKNPDGSFSVRLWLGDNDIVHMKKVGYQTLDDCEPETQVVATFFSRYTHLDEPCLCVDASELRGLSRETREFQAKLTRENPFRAVAAHGVGLLVRVIAMVFAKSVSNRPIQLFKTEADALHYLAQYTRDDTSTQRASPQGIHSVTQEARSPKLAALLAKWAPLTKMTVYGDQEYRTVSPPDWRFHSEDGLFSTMHTLIGDDTLLTNSIGCLKAPSVSESDRLSRQAVMDVGADKMYFIHDCRGLTKVERSARIAVKANFDTQDTVFKLTVIVGKPMHMIMMRWLRVLAPSIFKDWRPAQSINEALKIIAEHRDSEWDIKRERGASEPMYSIGSPDVAAHCFALKEKSPSELIEIIRDQNKQLKRHNEVLDLLIDQLGRLSWDSSAAPAVEVDALDPPFDVAFSALNLMNSDINEMVDALHSKMSEVTESQEHLKTAQAIAHLGSWKLDLVTGDLTWSDEVFRIFGYAPQSVQPTVELYMSHLLPAMRPEVEAILQESLESGTSFDRQLRIVRQDGIERIADERAEVIRDSAGRALRIQGTCHDITDLTRAREAEQKALEELGIREASLRETLLDLSHDVRTPLASLKLGLGRLASDGAHAALKAPLIAEIEYLDALFANLMTLIRYTNSTIEVKKHPICANEVIERVQARLSILADHRNVALDVAGTEGNLTMQADALALEQAIGNLVHNAVKFAVGNVAILVDRQPGHAVFQIRDDGPGMSPMEIPRVTKRYYRGSDRQKSSGRGLGLGLPIAKAIVEEHDGELTIARLPDGGTVVKVTLPIMG